MRPFSNQLVQLSVSCAQAREIKLGSRTRRIGNVGKIHFWRNCKIKYHKTHCYKHSRPGCDFQHVLQSCCGVLQQQEAELFGAGCAAVFLCAPPPRATSPDTRTTATRNWTCRTRPAGYKTTKTPKTSSEPLTERSGWQNGPVDRTVRMTERSVSELYYSKIDI